MFKEEMFYILILFPTSDFFHITKPLASRLLHLHSYKAKKTDVAHNLHLAKK